MMIQIRRPILLRAWRIHKNITQEQLAENVGMTKGHVSQLESGKQRYNQDHLETIGGFFQIDPIELIARNPNDPENILVVWNRIPKEDRAIAIRVLNQFADKLRA